MRHLPQHLQSGAVRFKATFHVGTQPLLYNKQHTPFYTPQKNQIRHERIITHCLNRLGMCVMQGKKISMPQSALCISRLL